MVVVYRTVVGKFKTTRTDDGVHVGVRRNTSRRIKYTDTIIFSEINSNVITNYRSDRQPRTIFPIFPHFHVSVVNIIAFRSPSDKRVNRGTFRTTHDISSNQGYHRSMHDNREITVSVIDFVI